MRSFRFGLALLLAMVVFVPQSVRAETERERERRAEEDKLWVELGSRRVEYKTERDTIEVGKQDGRFTHLRFKVDSGEVMMDKVKVIFGDGKEWETDFHKEFKEGARSHDIELPEGRHLIRKVEFVYHSDKRHEPATIVLLGKEAAR